MATELITIAPWLSGWTLASTQRFLLDENGNDCAIELSPKSIFADSEFDTAQTWTTGSATMGSWSVLNAANLTAMNENTTWKSRLYIQAATGNDFDNATTTSPFIYQSITGNFDIFIVGSAGPLAVSPGYAGVALLAQDPTNTTSYVEVGQTAVVSAGGNLTSGYQLFARNTVSGTSTDTQAVEPTGYYPIGGPVFIRLVNSSGTFTTYFSSDGKTWTSIWSGTNAALGSTLRVGIVAANVASTQRSIIDFIRNTNPYDTTGPSASYIFDSSANNIGRTWTMSTFQEIGSRITDTWDPYYQSGLGTRTYQYGASDSTPPALNGTWLTAAQMTAQANPSGRYFKLAVQLNSANGYQPCRFQGATIQGSVGVASPNQALIIQGIGTY